MNNKVNSKKLYDVFLLGVFLLHYYVQSLFLNLLNTHFFFSFLISFIPGVMTTLIFFVTQEKASRYYGRYLLVAFFMPFLIPIIVGLSLHFVDLNWDSTIDTIIGTYFLLGLPCTILGIVQLVLAVVCYQKCVSK